MRRLSFSLVSVLAVSSVMPAYCQRVISTIAVGNQPIYVAVDRETNRVYVSNQGDDTVSVIDGDSNTVLKTVRVGQFPNGIAVNARTNTIYVANFKSGSLSILNGTTLTTSTLRLGGSPSKMAVNPVTDRVYVTLEDQSGFVDVINGATRKLVASIPVPPYPLSIAVDADSNQVYVADFLCGCGKVSVVDGGTNEVTNTFELPDATLLGGVALDPKANRVYATDENQGFYVIERTTGTILGKFSDLKYPNEVATIPNSVFAVEPDTGSNTAVFIDASTFTVKKRVPVGKFPTGVAVNAATKQVYVANRQSNTISVIQLPQSW